MTREEAIEFGKRILLIAATDDDKTVIEFTKMAIQALSQEPCELLIIKSDILLHQDDRKKWTESIKREKESGVIILPPYFEPLLVPNDIEINIGQEPCTDAVSREAVIEWLKDKDIIKLSSQEETAIKELKALPSVTQKSGKWIKLYMSDTGKVEYECSKCTWISELPHYYCPNCGAKMESGDKE